jgi:selenium-binding protein 1
MTVVDCDEGSPSYGEVVGWTELPSAGNELHRFGWNACSSALCHEGHVHDGSLERRYLIVPGIRSSRVYVLDTNPDPRQPRIARTIEPGELAARPGYSRPHTVPSGRPSCLGGDDRMRRNANARRAVRARRCGPARRQDRRATVSDHEDVRVALRRGSIVPQG